MDASKKHRIDHWVEDVLYMLLEGAMKKGQITATDATVHCFN
jgi:predicted kinase